MTPAGINSMLVRFITSTMPALASKPTGAINIDKLTAIFPKAQWKLEI